MRSPNDNRPKPRAWLRPLLLGAAFGLVVTGVLWAAGIYQDALEEAQTFVAETADPDRNPWAAASRVDALSGRVTAEIDIVAGGVLALQQQSASHAAEIAAARAEIEALRAQLAPKPRPRRRAVADPPAASYLRLQ